MDTRVLVGIQDSKGTPKTTEMQLFYATNFNVKGETNKIESAVLGAGRWTKDTVAGRRSVSGDFELNPNLEQLETVLLGAGFDKNDKIIKSGTFSKYLTLINDFPSNDFNMQFNDCLVNTIGITVAQEQYVSVKVGVIGMQDVIGETKYNSALKVEKQGEQLLCYNAVVKDAKTDVSIDLESIDININNSLEGKGGLNTRHFTKILQSGRGNIEVSLKFDAFDKARYKSALELIKNNQSVEVELILQEDVSKEKSAPQKVMRILLPKVKITGVDIEDLNGSGGITKNMSALPNENGDPILIEYFENLQDALNGTSSKKRSD